MADNIKLRFFRHSGTPDSVAQGDIVFNPQSKRISIYNGTALEQYGGEIEDASFEGGILTITKKAIYNQSKGTWENPTITLDFSDVASATDVSKVVGGLKATVDSQGAAITTLTNTVGSATSGLVKDVNTLKSEVETSKTGLLDRVTALETATGTGSEGISNLNNRLTTAEGEIDTLQANVTALENNKANKATTLSGYGITDAYTKTEINSKLSSVYKAQGSKTSSELTSSLLVNSNEGYVYNISNEITITDANKSLFVEGVNSSYPAGTNIVVVKVGNAYKFDAIAGFVDLTAYAKTADQKTITDALSGRITTLENFKNGTNSYQYFKNLTSTHTNSAVSGSPTNMIAVTANNKATGEVTININETALDNKLKEMSTAISNADAAAKAGVLSFGGKTGAITVRSGSTTSWDANFTMNNNELRGTVVPPKSKGSATQPIYFDANGNISNVGIDTTATSGSKKLITSGAVFSAVSTAQTTLQNNINNLNQINWASF